MKDAMRAPDWTSDRDDDEADRALGATIERELPGLLALAQRLTRGEQDAQDAVQDATERAWRSRRTLRDGAAARGWLRTILARSVVDAHRRRSGRAPNDADQGIVLIADVEDPAAVLAAVEDDLMVRAALRELSSADRVAVVLHDAEGWSVAEIAELSGVGTEAAHKRLQRARVRLIAALAAQHGAIVTGPAQECRDARAHAHELLDGTLSEAAATAVSGHLDSCARCPAALQVAAAVLHGLNTERGVAAVPEPLYERIAQLVRAADEAP
jgi:RNA polymerase sigma factor (sigma-70 family)